MKTTLRKTFVQYCHMAALLVLVGGPNPLAAAGQWVPLAEKFPQVTSFKGVGLKLLLSDGSVMAQICTNSVTCGKQWAKLVPDAHGSYINGKWTLIASANFERANYSSVVLPDGRVFVIGGEYTNNISGSQGELYDPASDKWTLTAPIPSSLFDGSNGSEFDDAQSMTLPGGRVLIAPVRSPGAYDTLIYDSVANAWLAGAKFSNGKGKQDEATWVKLPDDSILVPDNDNVHTERYIPSRNEWVNDAPIPANAELFGEGEMGAAFLLPNGNAFFLGATGHTSIYTPPQGTAATGVWVAGPDIPNGRVTADAPAAMMANGKILVAVGASAQDGGSGAPTWFYEFDYADRTGGANGSFSATSSPGNSTLGSSVPAPAGNFTFLDLPDGSIMASQGADASGQLYVYVPGSPQLAAGKPTVKTISTNAAGGYHLVGTGLDGISEGAAFGDDAQMDSNYPLVRLTSRSGEVYYARTQNWSSTSVMTGGRDLSTEFSLPSALLRSNPKGAPFSLAVVANGIASDPVEFDSPYCFIQQIWTGAWGSDGPIFVGDLNGDGKADVFMWRDSDKSWTVNLSTGTGFIQQQWKGAWGSDGPIFVGDLNGDKKTDVVMWRDSDKSWSVNLSTGSGFRMDRWVGAWGSDGPIHVGDLNGDGKADIFMWRNTDSVWTVNLSQ